MERTGLGALLVSALVCLPCMVTVLATLGGLALLSATWGALRDNVAFILPGGMGAALVIAGAVYRIRRHEQACRQAASTDEEGRRVTGRV